MAIDFSRRGDFDECADIVVVVPQGQRVRIRVVDEPSMDVVVVEYTKEALVVFSIINGDRPEFDDGQVHVVFEETYRTVEGAEDTDTEKVEAEE
jgi:hypothetical protein